MDGDRLARWSTEAEQRWLADHGSEPTRPGDRAPARAPLLLPRAGGGAFAGASADTSVFVRGTDLVLAGHAGDRVLAANVRRVVWLVDGGEGAARLQTTPLGYVAFDSGDENVIALKVADWVPGDAAGPGTELLRAAGFEAVADALVLPLEVITGSGAVGWAAGGRVVHPPVARARGGLIALIVFLVLCVPAAALSLARHQQQYGALASVGFLGMAAVDPIRLLLRRRTPPPVDEWWSAGGRAGLGVRRSGSQQELLVSDSRGWVARLAGPAAGGVSSAVVTAGVLVLLDRTETQVVAMPWPAPPVDLLERLGVVVSRADGTLHGLHEATRPSAADALGDGVAGTLAVGLSMLLILAGGLPWFAAVFPVLLGAKLATVRWLDVAAAR